MLKFIYAFVSWQALFNFEYWVIYKMLESLIKIDKLIFTFFNTTISNPIFDVFFPIITNQDIWIFPILAGVVMLSIKGGRRGKICSGVLIVGIILADYTSAQILKPFF